MSDKDVDAQFADIVAHWDDVATLPEDRVHGSAASPPADGSAPAPTAPAAPTAPTATTAPTDDPQPDHAGTAPGHASRPGVSPPRVMGFVVWRGTAPGPRADDVEDPVDV